MASSKTVTYRAQGLYSYPNQFSAPDGALSACTGIFIDRPGVIEAARKYTTFGTISLTSTYTGIERCIPVMQGSDNVVFTAKAIAQETKVSGTAGAGRDYGKIYDAATGTSWGDPGGRVFSSFEANRNVYFAKAGAIGSVAVRASSNGSLLRYTSPSTFQTRGCGMPEAPTPGFYTGTSAYGLSGLPSLTGDSWGPGADLTLQRAYRVLFLTKDANGNLIRGAPSGRLIVYNPGADFGVLVFGPGTCSGSGLVAGDIIQLYASEIAPQGIDEPSDDMRLVYEHILTSGNITDKYVSIQDITPDELRGASLYTNDTQDGILMAEQPPPPAAYATQFKGVSWYSGVNWPGYSSVVINLLGTDGFSADAPATTITVGSYTITCGTGDSMASGQFSVQSTGSASQQLFGTAQSICRALNYASTGDILAIYATPPNSTSAIIIIKYFGSTTLGKQATGALPATISVSVAHLGTGVPVFSPALPVNTAYPESYSRLYYSKPSQPEAVPEINYVTVGSSALPINGMAYLRDSLFIYKPDGLFRVTGTTAVDIRVESFDPTVKTYAGQFTSIASAGNQLFSICNQGVISTTETGVRIISRQIEDLIIGFCNRAIASNNSGQVGGAWLCSGAASESERKYFLQLGMGTGSATVVTYVYNFLNEVWTQLDPLDTTNAGCICVMSPFAASSGIEYVIVPKLNSGTVSNIVRLGNPDSVSTPYLTSPTWTYSLNPGGDVTELKRFEAIKIVTLGSGTIADMSVTFSSDTGASPVTQTVVPYNNTTVNVQVPQSHALSGRLTLQITGPSTGGNAFVVSEIHVSYTPAGDWTAK